MASIFVHDVVALINYVSVIIAWPSSAIFYNVADITAKCSFLYNCSQIENISNIAWQGEEDMFALAGLNKNGANRRLKKK